MRTFNERLVLRFSAYIFSFLNALLDVYLLVSLSLGDIDFFEALIGIVISMAVWGLSIVMFIMGRKSTKKLEDLNIKDAVLVVVGSWAMLIFIGGIPYYLYYPSIVDAIFESASGFTTTGSSIFTNVEFLPASLLLWRSLTQWVGGMGIVLFFVSVIPGIGAAGKSLFTYEVPGPVKESMTPQIHHTARILWQIYLSLTVALILILKLQGISWFDAINHAFTTLSTGGFSTKNDSVMSFSNGAQWTIIVFMLLGGTNFGLYRLFLSRERKSIFKDVEVKWYLGFILVLTLIMVGWNLIFLDKGLEENLRKNLFTVVSMITTTGFANADYELFPIVLQAILLLTLFTGGSTGSTSGGIKFYRIVLIYRALSEQIKNSITPNLVSSVKVGGRLLRQQVVFSTFVFVLVYIVTILVGAIFFTATGLDFHTAFTASATFVGNVGPGFSTIGPTDNFAHFSDIAKMFGAFLMVLGRLEFFAVLTIFHRFFWREN